MVDPGVAAMWWVFQVITAAVIKNKIRKKEVQETYVKIQSSALTCFF